MVPRTVDAASPNWLVLLLLAGPANLVEETSAKEGIGIVGFSTAAAVVAYGAGHWDWFRMSTEGVRVLWLLTFASLPWGVGILAAKLVWRFDEDGRPMHARWHWGQVVMATVAMIALAGVGLVGFVVTMLILDDCPVADWTSACRMGLWTYGVVGVLYGIALMVAAPVMLWWDSFLVRAQRLEAASQDMMTRAYEAGRRAGKREGIREKRALRRQERSKGDRDQPEPSE